MSSIKLISKKALYPFFNLSEDNDTLDSLIEMFAGSVTELFQYHLGRKLEKAVQIDYFPLLDENIHYLYSTQYPIDGSLPISFTCSSNLSRSDSVDQSAFIKVNNETGLILFFPEPYLPIYSSSENFKLALELSYTFGYPLINSTWDYLDVPDAIATAAALQISYFLETHQRGSIGFQSISGDNLTSQKVTVKGDMKISLLPEVLALLRPFVKKSYIAGKSDVF